jgi:hypothetical protein
MSLNKQQKKTLIKLAQNKFPASPAAHKIIKTEIENIEKNLTNFDNISNQIGYENILENLSMLQKIGFHEIELTFKIVDDFLDKILAIYQQNLVIFNQYQIENLIGESLVIISYNRYIEPELTFNFLYKNFNKFQATEFSKKIIEVTKEFSKFNIKEIKRNEFELYLKIVECIKNIINDKVNEIKDVNQKNFDQVNVNTKIANYSFIYEVALNLLSCEAKSEDHNFDSISFSRGLIPVNQCVLMLRWACLMSLILI